VEGGLARRVGRVGIGECRELKGGWLAWEEGGSWCWGEGCFSGKKAPAPTGRLRPSALRSRKPLNPEHVQLTPHMPAHLEDGVALAALFDVQVSGPLLTGEGELGLGGFDLRACRWPVSLGLRFMPGQSWGVHIC
jgi:hypothetical protein